MTKEEIKAAAAQVHACAHNLLCAAEKDDYATVRALANALSEDCQLVAHGVLKMQHATQEETR